MPISQYRIPIICFVCISLATLLDGMPTAASSIPGVEVQVTPNNITVPYGATVRLSCVITSYGNYYFQNIALTWHCYETGRPASDKQVSSFECSSKADRVNANFGDCTIESENSCVLRVELIRNNFACQCRPNLGESYDTGRVYVQLILTNTSNPTTTTTLISSQTNILDDSKVDLQHTTAVMSDSVTDGAYDATKIIVITVVVIFVMCLILVGLCVAYKFRRRCQLCITSISTFSSRTSKHKQGDNRSVSSKSVDDIHVARNEGEVIARNDSKGNIIADNNAGPSGKLEHSSKEQMNKSKTVKGHGKYNRSSREERKTLMQDKRDEKNSTTAIGQTREVTESTSAKKNDSMDKKQDIKSLETVDAVAQTESLKDFYFSIKNSDTDSMANSEVKFDRKNSENRFTDPKTMTTPTTFTTSFETRMTTKNNKYSSNTNADKASREKATNSEFAQTDSSKDFSPLNKSSDKGSMVNSPCASMIGNPAHISESVTDARLSHCSSDAHLDIEPTGKHTIDSFSTSGRSKKQEHWGTNPIAAEDFQPFSIQTNTCYKDRNSGRYYVEYVQPGPAHHQGESTGTKVFVDMDHLRVVPETNRHNPCSKSSLKENQSATSAYKDACQVDAGQDEETSFSIGSLPADTTNSEQNIEKSCASVVDDEYSLSSSSQDRVSQAKHKDTLEINLSRAISTSQENNNHSTTTNQQSLAESSKQPDDQDTDTSCEPNIDSTLTGTVVHDRSASNIPSEGEITRKSTPSAHVIVSSSLSVDR